MCGMYGLHVVNGVLWKWLEVGGELAYKGRREAALGYLAEECGKK